MKRPVLTFTKVEIEISKSTEPKAWLLDGEWCALLHLTGKMPRGRKPVTLTTMPSAGGWSIFPLHGNGFDQAVFVTTAQMRAIVTRASVTDWKYSPVVSPQSVKDAALNREIETCDCPATSMSQAHPDYQPKYTENLRIEFSL